MRIHELVLERGLKYRDRTAGTIWAVNKYKNLICLDQNGNIARQGQRIEEVYNLPTILDMEFFKVGTMPFKNNIIQDNDPFICPYCGNENGNHGTKNYQENKVEEYFCPACERKYKIFYKPTIYEVFESF